MRHWGDFDLQLIADGIQPGRSFSWKNPKVIYINTHATHRRAYKAWDWWLTLRADRIPICVYVETKTCGELKARLRQNKCHQKYLSWCSNSFNFATVLSSFACLGIWTCTGDGQQLSVSTQWKVSGINLFNITVTENIENTCLSYPTELSKFSRHAFDKWQWKPPLVAPILRRLADEGPRSQKWPHEEARYFENKHFAQS